MANTFENPPLYARRASFLSQDAWFFIFFGIMCVWTTVLFQTPSRPDEYKYVREFSELFLPGYDPSYIDLVSQVFMRSILLLGSMSAILFLYRIRLVTSATLRLILVWPLAPYFFSKLHWEIVTYVLCMIRTDLPPRKELGLLAVMAMLVYITGEGNLLVLIFFRLCMFVQRNSRGLRMFVIPGLIGSALIIDLLLSSDFRSGIPLFDAIFVRFEWTREIENPEYSPIETLAIILTGLHFFTVHTGIWLIDLAFTLLVLGYLATNREFCARVKFFRRDIFLLAATIFFFTNITYSFQDTRYYFFFLPILAKLIPHKTLPALALFALAHIMFKSVEPFV